MHRTEHSEIDGFGFKTFNLNDGRDRKMFDHYLEEYHRFALPIDVEMAKISQRLAEIGSKATLAEHALALQKEVLSLRKKIYELSAALRAVDTKLWICARALKRDIDTINTPVGLTFDEFCEIYGIDNALPGNATPRRHLRLVK